MIKFHLDARTTKTILFVLAVCLLYGYLYMENSTDLKEYMARVDNHSTTTGFKLYVFVGIIQYGMLISGLSVLLSLVILLFKKD